VVLSIVSLFGEKVGDWVDGQSLRICELNAENLFISMAYHAGECLEDLNEAAWREMALSQLRRKQKPLWQLWDLSKAIRDIDPDILMLVEVGGLESLDHFNRYFLADRYSVFFIEGNARRGIDLGYLVRKGLRFEIEARSNRETPVEVSAWQGKYLARFSRDVAELRLSNESGLKLILLLTHLKSKLSTDMDYKGKDVRTAEAFALAELYEGLRLAHPDTPIIVGGDFNSDLASLELTPLGITDLVSFHDVLETPADERTTLVHFDHAGSPVPMTLDHLMISPHLRDRVIKEESFTYRYKGFYEMPEALPQNLRQRRQMPSDHYPLVLTIRF
jgi:endonuclease/exonuclease/phosphatase family metal-dependent hydrolase